MKTNENNIETEIKNAISRSISHDEIVHISADDDTQAMQMVTEATIVAGDSDSDWAKDNDGYDVWAGVDGSDAMLWRLKITVRA
jgi:hypothetical protein